MVVHWYIGAKSNSEKFLYKTFFKILIENFANKKVIGKKVCKIEKFLYY